MGKHRRPGITLVIYYILTLDSTVAVSPHGLITPKFGREKGTRLTEENKIGNRLHSATGFYLR